MLNPIEEARHAELKKMCRELKVPAPPEVFIGMKVHDKNGVLILDDVQRGHSWVRNFYNMMFSVLYGGCGSGSNNFGAGYISAKATDATVCYSASGPVSQTRNYTHCYMGGAADLTSGIVVGTGDTAWNAAQYALASVIANGTGSGQFSYLTNTINAAGYTAGTKTWAATITRVMNNNSGGSITVKETGLYWYAANSGNGYGIYGTAGKSFMTDRTVLSPTVAVANGAQLTVTYTISMDFSAIDS